MNQHSIMLGKYRPLLFLGALGVCLGQTPNLPAVYSLSGGLRSQVTKLEKLSRRQLPTPSSSASIRRPPRAGRAGRRVGRRRRTRTARQDAACRRCRPLRLDPAPRRRRTARRGRRCARRKLSPADQSRAVRRGPGHTWQDAAPIDARPTRHRRQRRTGVSSRCPAPRARRSSTPRPAITGTASNSMPRVPSSSSSRSN